MENRTQANIWKISIKQIAHRSQMWIRLQNRFVQKNLSAFVVVVGGGGAFVAFTGTAPCECLVILHSVVRFLCRRCAQHNLKLHSLLCEVWHRVWATVENYEKSRLRLNPNDIKWLFVFQRAQKLISRSYPFLPFWSRPFDFKACKASEIIGMN